MVPPSLRTVTTTLAASLPLLLACIAEAQTITMTGSNTSGSENWHTQADWSESVAFPNTRDYSVGLQGVGIVRTLRTPSTTGPHTFGGASLTIAGGQMNLAAGGTGEERTSTVADLRFTDGGILLNGLNSTALQTLTGALHFSNGTAPFNVIRTAGTGISGSTRHIEIESLVSGNGTVRLVQNGSVTLDNAASTFGGTWHVGGSATGVNSDGGPTTFGNSSTVRTAFAALSGTASVGSLGLNSSVVVDLFSTFNLDYDWVTDGSLTLVLNDTAFADAIRMTLDQNITVGALTVAGQSFAPDTYDFSDFTAAGFTDYFTDFGGTITVVPEPSACAMLLAGAGLCGVRRRRR